MNICSQLAFSLIQDPKTPIQGMVPLTLRAPNGGGEVLSQASRKPKNNTSSVAECSAP